MRDITLIINYPILFNQRRDISQINILAGQVMPGQRREFMKIYKSQ